MLHCFPCSEHEIVTETEEKEEKVYLHSVYQCYLEKQTVYEGNKITGKNTEKRKYTTLFPCPEHASVAEIEDKGKQNIFLTLPASLVSRKKKLT